MTCTISWIIFYFKLHCSLIFGKCFLCVLFFGSSQGNFRQWETQLRQSHGPFHCLHLVHTPHHLEIGSSDPLPQTPDHCWLTDLDLSFSNCLGLEWEQNLHHLVKDSWMERISYFHCNPGECWLCCCLR